MKAANDRLKKEWQVEPPKCLLSGMGGKDADMYSIGNSIVFFVSGIFLYLSRLPCYTRSRRSWNRCTVWANEARFDNFDPHYPHNSWAIKRLCDVFSFVKNRFSTYKPFKTRKQIRKEKYGVDEDADEILLDRVAIPRRKDHERNKVWKHDVNKRQMTFETLSRLWLFSNIIRGGLADVDSLAERHKNLVGDILERRQARLERAQDYFIIKFSCYLYDVGPTRFTHRES